MAGGVTLTRSSAQCRAVLALIRLGLGAGVPSTTCTATSTRTWPGRLVATCLQSGCGRRADSAALCAASASPHALVSTQPADQKPVQLPGQFPPPAAWMAYPPFQTFRRATRPPFDTCHRQPGTLGARPLTRALATAAHFNTEASWRELLMLPQTVLAAPPREGKKHKKALAAYTLDRLERWHEGEAPSGQAGLSLPNEFASHEPRRNVKTWP